MKTIMIFFLALRSLTVCSQDYNIESHFKTEKTYHFTVKRAKIDSREPMSKDLAQLTQIEASFTQHDKFMKCVWKYGETKATGSEYLISRVGPEYNELINIYRGFEIEVLFDPYYGGIELLNYEKMKENIKDGLLKIYNNQITTIDSATMVLLNQQLEPTYSTPEMLLSIYFPEITLYFSLYSRIFTKGVGIKSEYSYPNPFGGEAFPIIGKMSIDSANSNTLIIKNKEEAKQEEVNRILKNTLEKMSMLGTAPIDKEEMPDFTLISESYFYYDIQNKIINKVLLEKRIEVSGITQTEILEINLIE